MGDSAYLTTLGRQTFPKGSLTGAGAGRSGHLRAPLTAALAEDSGVALGSSG